MMGRLSCLLSPRSVAVVGANDDLTTYGGRIWRYLRRDFPGPAYAVNRRAGAVRAGQCVASLKELGEAPDAIVLATPGGVVPALLCEAGQLGVRAAVVLARESLGHEEDLRAIADEHGMHLLGPNCLGLINANASTALSSSISLERPLRRGPFALVSQSGALMGVLHARGTDIGLGLGLCISTGSQAQLRVEDFLLEIAGLEEIQAVAAYLEDLDVPLFEAAVRALEERGVRPVVLKGGLTDTGSQATSAHSRALASDGRTFQYLASEIGAITVEDPDELLAALVTSRTTGSRLHIATVSGGLGAIAADQAEKLGLTLPLPAPRTLQKLEGLAMPALANPLDLEAVPSSAQQKVAAIAALVHDPQADCVLVIVNDMPGLDQLLDRLAPVAGEAADRLIVCSVCSDQSDELWDVWTTRGLLYLEGLSTTLRSVARLHPRDTSLKRVDVAWDGQMAPEAVLDALSSVGIPTLPTCEVDSAAEALRVAGNLGYPIVLKVARAHHRSAAGVRLGLQSGDEVAGAFDELADLGPVLVQTAVRPGLEFYVGVIADPCFGLLLMVGMGGVNVERARDIAVAHCPVEVHTVSQVIERTVVGRWLDSPASRDLVDLDALVGIAQRATELAATLGSRFRTLDLNPVVVHPSGATVVDAKITLAAAASETEQVQKEMRA